MNSTASKCELEALTKQLQSKIDENRQLKSDENNALVELAQYKEECQRLNGKLSLLDSEMKYGDALEHQKKRLEDFQDQIDDLQKINDDLNGECVKLRSYNEQLTSDIDALRSERDELNGRLLQIQSEHQELKNKYVEVTEAKERINDELTQLLRQNEIAADTLRKSPSISCTKCIDNKTLITKVTVVRPIYNVDECSGRSSVSRCFEDKCSASAH